MSTKLTGDVTEQAVILKLLELGYGISRPIGDRLPYDLILDVGGKLLKIQVKTAWFHRPHNCYYVDVRRTKTNRRTMVRELYSVADFDFSLVYIPAEKCF